MTYIQDIPKSSLLNSIEFCDETNELCLFFKNNYYTDKIIYTDVPHSFFVELCESKSFGKFYLSMIKPNFKQLKTRQMSEKKMPTGINVAKNEKRYLQMRLDVKKMNKDFFYVGKEGVYCDVTLHMKPDGEVDKYGNLGFITQDVPYEMRKKDKDLKGEIIGNARENEWSGSSTSESTPGETENLEVGASEIDDDLPF